MEDKQLPIAGQTIEPLDIDSLEREVQAGFATDTVPAKATYTPEQLRYAVSHSGPSGFSRRKAVLVSVIITAVILLLTGVVLALQLTRPAAPEKTPDTIIQTQEVNLQQAGQGTLAPELQGDEEALLIEGDLIVRGDLKVVNGSAIALFDGQALTENQTYGLPNSSGVFCLDSNNCGFATQGQLAQSTATAARERRVTSINNQSGGLFLQGTTNQIAISNQAGTFTFSTPQDIHAGATPTFAGLNLTGSLAVQGNSATIGSSLQNGSLILYSNGQTATISANLTNADRSYVLPDGSGDFCIRQLSNCTGAEGGNAPVGAEYLTLSLNGDLTAERTLVFNATNFSVADSGANGSYSINTSQNIDASAAPTFAGLNLTGNLNLNANILQGTSAAIDFTNFDVSGTGIVVASGTIQGSQFISTVTSGSAPLIVSSSTKVTNLNADLLDGLDSTAFAAGSGSGNYIQNGTGLQSNANFNIQSSAPASIGGVIRAATGQTANLQEWQDSTGIMRGFIDPTGLKIGFSPGPGQLFQFDGGTGTLSGTGAITLEPANAVILNGQRVVLNSVFQRFNANEVALTARGAAGQTGDLQQWQNSAGTNLLRVESSGNLIGTGYLRLNSTGPSVIGGTSIYDGGLSLSVNGYNAGSSVMNIVGAVSQSGDLLQFRNSGGTILLNVTAGGILNLAATSTTGGHITQGGVRLIHTAGGPTNFFAGSQSGNLGQTGVLNTSVGTTTLQNNTTGVGNTALGAQSLQNNTTGGANTGSGVNTLFYNTTGGNNTALGYAAGISGTNANANTTGSNNTFIGYNSGPGSTTQLQNATSIGARSVVNQSDSLILGCIAGINGCTTSTRIGIGTATPTFSLDVVGYSTLGGLRINGADVSNTIYSGNNIVINSLGNILFQTNTGNRVGIGTTNPLSQLHLGSDAGTATSGLTFGTTGVTSANLYRSAADTLKTDDSFIVGANLNVSGASTLSSLTVTNDAAFSGNITFSANTRGKNEPVAELTTALVITGKIYPDADYSVLCTPNYNTSCYVTGKTSTGFTLNFGTAAPAGATVDWIVIR